MLSRVDEGEQDKSLGTGFTRVKEKYTKKAFAIRGVAEKLMKRNEKITYAIRNKRI
jgi:hypothetical protein